MSSSSFVKVDKAIIFGYSNVSSQAKMTYIALKSFDWEIKGKSKGYCFPSQKTLASLLGVSEKTIRRHLEELVDAGLIVVRKRGRNNVYWFADLAKEEVEECKDKLGIKDNKQDKPDTIQDNVVPLKKKNSKTTLKDQTVTRVTQDNVVPLKKKNSKTTLKDQTVTRVTIVSSQVSVIEDEDEDDNTSNPNNETLAALKAMKTNYELYMNREPSQLEQRYWITLAKKYSLEDLEDAFGEYVLQRDIRRIHAPLRYVAGILKNWTIEGKRLTDVFSFLQRLSRASATR